MIITGRITEYDEKNDCFTVEFTWLFMWLTCTIRGDDFNRDLLKRAMDEDIPATTDTENMMREGPITISISVPKEAGE